VSGRLLAGSVAVVAGAGRGIGAETACALADAGATVVAVDLVPERVEEVRARIASAGGSATGRVADLRDGAAIEELVAATMAEHGRIDVLANVAGGMIGLGLPLRRVHEWPDDAWDDVIALNLTYVFRICRAVLPHMVAAGGGAIVNVASLNSLVASPLMSAYGAAKAAVVNLTRSIANEYAGSGIRANCVAPGPISTAALAASKTGGQVRDLGAAVPLGRSGTPEEIARAVLYLASAESSYVTGQVLAVDGGAAAMFPLPIGLPSP
jgi:2-hydroxycyclohexanecarboxyl-CoA dehydrogenase